MSSRPPEGYAYANIVILAFFVVYITFAEILTTGNMVYLTRVEHFNAAHKLYNPEWTEEENRDVFGKCSNANWHGHNYELHVTVKGEPHPQTGFIFNAKTLGILIKDVVI